MTQEAKHADNEELKAHLDEAEQTLQAIRKGEVDALVVNGPLGEQVYTLKGADEPYRVMVEEMTEGAVTFSPDGTILYCNLRFAEMLKIAIERAIGASLQDFSAPGEIPALATLMQQCIANPVSQEISLRAQDGSIVPVLFSARALQLNKMQAIVSVITDLTYLKQTENRLKERVKELQAFFNLSELAERGDNNIDSLYQELANFLPASWRHSEIACARVVMGEREFRTGNFRLTEWMQAAPVKVHGSPAGKIEVGYLELRPQQDEGPFLKEERQLIDAIAERVGHITSRKLAEDELRKHHIHLEHMVEQRTAQFEAVSMELEGFAYSISHDLRVPMRAIDGFSNLLLKRYQDKLDEEGRRYLTLVRENTKKMNLLFDDILALSRMGRQRMAASEIDMEALVRSVVEELKPALAGRKLIIEIGPLPPCRGDLAMLRQVWVNLLDNAIKFTRPRDAALIEVGATPEEGELLYYVRDNGVGFDMQYADRLFGVFQRLHGIEEFEGSGVGLAMVKRILIRHGGRVWAEGKVDEGAVFYFALPCGEHAPGGAA